jgi:PIN domain nuclease of toxin-antitoxin system
MRYLLDTNAFLFTLVGSPRLSIKARSIIHDGENEIMVSSVTFWEISLKSGIGKLVLEGVTADELPAIAEKLGFTMIAIEPGEASSFYHLPRATHKDPFDRMLIWQALQRNIPLISCDRRFEMYLPLGLRIVW